VVIPGHPGQPGLAAGIQPPLQVIALDDDRSGYLAVLGPLRGGPDVDQDRSGGAFGEGLLRGQPQQPGAGYAEDLVDAAGPERAGRHHAAAASVACLTSPAGVSS
jgi:hypothetical protein